VQNRGSIVENVLIAEGDNSGRRLFRARYCEVSRGGGCGGKKCGGGNQGAFHVEHVRGKGQNLLDGSCDKPFRIAGRLTSSWLSFSRNERPPAGAGNRTVFPQVMSEASVFHVEQPATEPCAPQ
jgi:hypothetical protein